MAKGDAIILHDELCAAISQVAKAGVSLAEIIYNKGQFRNHCRRVLEDRPTLKKDNLIELFKKLEGLEKELREYRGKFFRYKIQKFDSHTGKLLRESVNDWNKVYRN